MAETENKVLDESLSASQKNAVSNETAEFAELNFQAPLRDSYLRAEQTTDELKWRVIRQAQAVILGLGFCLILSLFALLMFKLDHVSAGAQVAMVAAPIASIAAITIFSLIGVFSGGKKAMTSDTSQALTVAKLATDSVG